MAKFAPQPYILHGETQRAACLRVIGNLPLNGSVQVIVAPYVKPGSAAQRRTLWGVRLAEIAEQAWLDGKQYSPTVWHEYMKIEFLPNGPEEGITLPGYVKWLELPSGELRMVGSTERLTAKGRTEYMDRVEHFCALELGVRFSELRNETGRGG